MPTTELRRIDCDVHPGVPAISALLPFMSDYWQEQFTSREIDNLELAFYPPNAPITCRPDWRELGQKPASNLKNLQTNALDGLGVDLAICNPLYGGQVSMSTYMGAAICSAVNDWIRADWLDQDARLRSSIVVPAQDPVLAAQEIERCASDNRFVQVLLLSANELMLGRSYYWPIYEAAERFNLPIGIHAGSMYRYPITSCGWPTHLAQEYASAPQMFSAQVQSLLSEGVFEKFPSLTFVLIESGVGWVVPYMWRSSKTWRGVRGEVPWMKRSTLVELRERVRLTITPFDGADGAEMMDEFMQQLGSDEMLLFSSDYPHWQFDGQDPLPKGIGTELARKICVENPLKTYPRLEG